jgi:hypothetical protein
LTFLPQRCSIRPLPDEKRIPDFRESSDSKVWRIRRTIFGAARIPAGKPVRLSLLRHCDCFFGRSGLQELHAAALFLSAVSVCKAGAAFFVQESPETVPLPAYAALHSGKPALQDVRHKALSAFRAQRISGETY